LTDGFAVFEQRSPSCAFSRNSRIKPNTWLPRYSDAAPEKLRA
jgi:hypothetical protein